MSAALATVDFSAVRVPVQGDFGWEIDSALGAELLEPVEQQMARYSGKIVDQNAERVAGIVAARSIGLPLRLVCKSFRCSVHTILEIEVRHRVKLAALKERSARQFGAFVELGLARLLTEAHTMDIDRLPLAVAIAADKMQLLSGEATSIVGLADPQRHTVESLRARLRAESIEVSVEPVGAGEVSGQGDSPGAAGAARAGTDAAAKAGT